MFRSLWFKLVGALALVIVVTLVAVILTINLVTVRQYDLLVTHNGQLWATQLAPELAASYSTHGDWREAQTILTNPWADQDIPGNHWGMMGSDNHMPGMMGGGWGVSSGGMWDMMGFRLLLADEAGLIVADSEEAMQGQPLTEEALALGTPVIADGQQVGTLVVALDSPTVVFSPQVGFVLTVSRAAILAALAAGLAALVIGTWLFRRITRPLTALSHAARTMESGQFEVRVPASSGDELGAVAHSFNHMAEELQRQESLRQQMVADVAHELRTPLSVMQGTLEAMLDGVLKPSQKELRNLHGEARRLARLVEDLRTLSLADAGQLKLELAPVEIGDLVEQVAGSMESLARSRKIKMETQIASDLPAIRGDEDRLAQVLTNLIDNALRYTPQGGRVTVSAANNSDQIVLAVRDTGPGIAPQDIPMVFEHFWRGDKSRSRAGGGSGIGLAIVRQLARMHGGQAEVDSQIGQGSTFRVYLPIQ